MQNAQHLIDEYLLQLKADKNKEEQYKWEAIDHFQKTWDIEADDIATMFREAYSKRSNLFYMNAWGTMSNVVEHFPNETREMFKKLYDEELSLEVRFQYFIERSETIVPQLMPILGKQKMNHYQDERTIACYLTFRYPEKYFLYMNKFYKRYCKLIGEDSKPAGEKYFHYLKLMMVFKKDYILANEEILDIHQSLNPDLSWDDSNLIAQNVLFTMLGSRNDKNNNNTSEINPVLNKFMKESTS